MRLPWFIIILVAINLALTGLLLFGESVLFSQINKPAPPVHYEMKQVSKPPSVKV